MCETYVQDAEQRYPRTYCHWINRHTELASAVQSYPQGQVPSLHALALNKPDRGQSMIFTKRKNTSGHWCFSFKLAKLVRTASLSPMLDQVAYLVYRKTRYWWTINQSFTCRASWILSSAKPNITRSQLLTYICLYSEFIASYMGPTHPLSMLMASISR